MLGHLWNKLVIAIYIFNTFNSISADLRVGLVVQCRNQILNLNYNASLPAATNGNITVHVEDNRTWETCQLRNITNVNIVILLPVKVYASITLSRANCKQAIFTELRMIGNFNLTLGAPVGIFNFTMDLSDPTQLRQLNKPQKFTAPATLPIGINTSISGNFTYKFLQEKHESGCQAIANEQVLVDADLYVLSTDSLASIFHL